MMMRALFFLSILFPLAVAASGIGGGGSHIGGLPNKVNSLEITTATINGGTIDNAVIGGATAANATFAKATIAPSSGHAWVDLIAATGAQSIIRLYAGDTAKQYQLYFDSAGNRVALWSSDVNGSGASGDILSNTLGTDDLTMSGGLTVGDTVISVKVCASGYTRIGTNYCSLDADIGYSLTLPATCTAIAAPSSDAKFVVVGLALTTYSTGGTGQRITTAKSYQDSSCATGHRTRQLMTYEQAATTSGTALAQELTEIEAPVVSGNIYMTGATSGVVYGIVGYYD